MGNITGKPTIGTTQVSGAGTTSNDADEAIDLALTDSLTVTVTDTNAATITNADPSYDFTRNMLFVLTAGAPAPTGPVTITVPAVAKGIFTVKNNLAFDATVQIAGQSETPDAVPAGKSAPFVSGGANVRIAGAPVENLADLASKAFLDLDDTPTSYAGQGTKAMAVNAGATALEFVDFPTGSGGDALPFTLSPRWNGVRVRKSADENSANYSSAKKVPWNTVLHGNSSYFNDANDRLIVPAGVTKVRITGAITVTAADATTDVLLDIYKNGTAYGESSRSRSTVTGSSAISTHVETGVIEVVENDYFELFLHSIGDSLVNVVADRSWLQMEIIETTDTVPSLRTVVTSLPAKSRGALVKLSADLTAQNITASANIGWDAEVYDTDDIHDTATNKDRLVVPAGVAKVRLTANLLVQNVTDGTFINMNILTDGNAVFDGMASDRKDADAATVVRLSATTGIINVTQGQYFVCRVFSESDTSVDIVAAQSSFAMEIVEFNSSTDAPTAYIAVPPEHKGVSLSHNGTETINDASSLDIAGWDNIESGTNSFDPGDGGPPQRFWLGADQTFTDGNVTVGTDNVAVTGHGFETGEGPVTLTSSGALPTGLATATKYWIIRVDANNLKFAVSRANALAGTAVDITAAAGGGTHTIETAEKLVVPAGVARVQLSGGAIITATANLVRFFVQIVEGTGGTFLDQQATSGDLTQAGARANTFAQVVDVTEGQFFALRALQDSDGSENVQFGNFAISVLEETRAITYPGVTVTPPWRGARARSDGTGQVGVNWTSLTALAWNLEDIDTDGFHDTATNNSRMTIPAGSNITRVRLRCTLGVNFVGAIDSMRCMIQKNGATIVGDVWAAVAPSGEPTRLICTSIVDAPVPGDYYEAFVDLGSDTSVDLATAVSFFEIEVVETSEAAQPPESLKAHVTTADKLVVSSVVAKWIADRRISLADEFAGSVGHAGAGPNGGSVVFNVDIEGLTVGTITFADSSGSAQTATFASIGTGAETVDVGQRLEIVSPSNLQSMDDVAFTLQAWRS